MDATLEVTNEKVNGNSRLQIWGPKPNKRSNSTVLIGKIGGNDPNIVEILANGIIKPLLEHLLTNVDAKGLLKESEPKKEIKERQEEKKKSKEKSKPKPQPEKFNSTDCDTCGEGLQSIRSLRRHKRQEHIEAQPPAGTKRRCMTETNNVINPRLNDPTNSPPSKLRAVTETVVHDEGTPQLKDQSVEVTPRKKEENFDLVKALEETIKKLMEQKEEDKKIISILQEDLIKANEYVTAASEREAAKLDNQQEDFLTDSEEERVHRNVKKGRGFLKAKRTLNKNTIQTNKCTNCEEYFESMEDLNMHIENHETEASILAKGKSIGFRRTDPMSATMAKAATQKINTLCHICSLRCQTKEKLETHMKNHTKEQDYYSMKYLQKAIEPIVTQEAIESAQGSQSDNKCRKCGIIFSDPDDLKKHVKIKHKTHRPCKNFSNDILLNKCSWNEKCDYNHIILKPGTWLCWDCGNIFASNNDMMTHRKKNHDVPIFRLLKTDAGCDKSDEVCWYKHKGNQHERKAQNAHDNPNTAQAKLDFPEATQNKSIPNRETEDTPTKMETLMWEMMKQNKTMMESILCMIQQNQHQISRQFQS